MKKITIVVLVILAGSIGFIIYKNNTATQETLTTDYKNATYIISGRVVKLTNGISTITASNDSSITITDRYFGNEISADINNDGVEDVVFLVTQETGGSGTFFYLVGAIKEEGGYRGTNAVFIGDRIAPQTTELKDGLILVNYADRAPGEPMTTPPSVGKTLRLKYSEATNDFGEVVQNFEGEADPSRMDLSMKPWRWVEALYNDGKRITPNRPDAFMITFNPDGHFSASTDCNGIGGSYTTDENRISFSEMISTLMYCEGSQESDFRHLLENTASYHFTSKGQLIFDLKFDSGSVIFQ